MPIINRPRAYPLASTFATSAPYSRTTSRGTWSETDYKVWQKVDPVMKLYHGPYERRMLFLSNLPHVSGVLRFKGKLPPAVNETQRITSTGFGWITPSTSWLPVLDRKRAMLINNCLVGAKEEQVNVALFIGELNKTAELLHDTASRIARAAKDVKNGRFTRAARELKIVKPKKARRSRKYADNWLEYSYGWTPLVQDMVGAMQHLHRGARGLYIKSRSRVTTVKPPYYWTGQIVVDQQTASQHRLLNQWKVNASYSVHEQVRLVLRLNEYFWDQVSRLGFMDPGTLVLESIPLSFVAEWFVNIGDVLRDLNTGLTLDYVTCSYTEYHRYTGTLIGNPVWTDLKNLHYTYAEVSANCSDATFADIRVRREVVTKADVQVTFALSVPLSVNQAITSVSLVAQRLPR